MSLVYIYHNENVFDLDREEKIRKPQKFKFESQFKEMIKKQTFQTQIIESEDGKKLLTNGGKHEHRTMGYEQTPLKPPAQFLRKHQGIKWRRMHDHICPRDSCLPPVPRRPSTISRKVGESPYFEQQRRSNTGNIDFIALNIENVKHLRPKQPSPNIMDTATGDRQDLIKAGLIPQYIKRESFGKVPSYLQAHKKVLQQIQGKFETGWQSLDQHPHHMSMYDMRKLDSKERETLLMGLKNNFMEQSKIFQRLSLHTDTIAKKMRKSRIENTLRQLEQDIYLIERNPTIYISNY